MMHILFYLYFACDSENSQQNYVTKQPKPMSEGQLADPPPNPSQNDEEGKRTIDERKEASLTFKEIRINTWD